ncbi:MAG: transcriptional regulator, partial [Clostridia bacterium]|nr:transcriptional regulator [Clostridia bacterium]
MGYLSEKAAYLKGLSDGMKLAEKSDEGKMIAKLISMMEDMAASIDETDAVLDEFDERLDDLEEFATDVSEACSGCDCDDDCDCDCDCDCDDEDDYDDVEFYEVECPHCEEKVYFDE